MLKVSDLVNLGASGNMLIPSQAGSASLSGVVEIGQATPEEFAVIALLGNPVGSATVRIKTSDSNVTAASMTTTLATLSSQTVSGNMLCRTFLKTQAKRYLGVVINRTGNTVAGAVALGLRNKIAPASANNGFASKVAL